MSLSKFDLEIILAATIPATIQVALDPSPRDEGISCNSSLINTGIYSLFSSNWFILLFLLCIILSKFNFGNLFTDVDNFTFFVLILIFSL